MDDVPRRNRALRPDPPPGGSGQLRRVETFRGEPYQVRSVGGERGYRCPGCDQLIAAGVPHVVAWSADGDGDDRRHWHTPCWAARERRTAVVPRARSARRT